MAQRIVNCDALVRVQFEHFLQQITRLGRSIPAAVWLEGEATVGKEPIEIDAPIEWSRFYWFWKFLEFFFKL